MMGYLAFNFGRLDKNSASACLLLAVFRPKYSPSLTWAAARDSFGILLSL